MDVDDSNESLSDQCQDLEISSKKVRLANKLISAERGHTSNPLISGGNILLTSTSRSMVNPGTKINDLVPHSLLTESDLEIWKEIQSALKENRSLDFLDELDNNPSMFNI